MSHQLAIFFHVKLSNIDPPIIFEKAIAIMAEQILALEKSGLSEAASEIFVGVAGGWEDAVSAKAICPEKAHIVQHPEGSRGEQPTLHMLQKWLPDHRDWYVLYFHTKSVSHTTNPVSTAWRHCMEKVVIGNWELCVRALDSGFDLAGPHLITAENCSVAPVVPYFGGNFWWAKAEFLLTLPPIAPTAVEWLNRFDAEVWIARGQQKAKIMDFAKHFPGAKCLEAMNAS